MIFIQKMEGDKVTPEGLCIKCAKELNVGSINQMIDQLGISDEELARRKEKWQPREPEVTTGYLARYAAMVTSGNRGAVLEVPHK